MIGKYSRNDSDSLLLKRFRMNPPPLIYKFMHYTINVDGYEVGSYEVGIYEVNSYEWSTIPSTTLTLYINCSITLVVVNN